jgi:enoyl-CoA hydratase/carnithine racemase
MILTGEPVDTAFALRAGLVDAVVPMSDLDAELESAISRALSGDANAMTARRRSWFAAHH